MRNTVIKYFIPTTSFQQFIKNGLGEKLTVIPNPEAVERRAAAVTRENFIVIDYYFINVLIATVKNIHSLIGILFSPCHRFFSFSTTYFR
jgi:hypothetical protein